jgi:hypothetical protein
MIASAGGLLKEVLMSANLNESLTATHRKLPLVSLGASDEGDQAVVTSQPSEHETMYVAFDMPSTPSAAKSAEPEDARALAQSQALELAADRAEIARQQRENEDLQRALRLRDGWLQGLRSDLRSLQEDKRNLTAELENTRLSLKKVEEQLARQGTRIKELEADAADRMGKTIFPSDRVPPIGTAGTETLDLENPTKLHPLDGDGAPVVLNRKVMTVGRTRENHVFVPSQLVSRDHARFLVSEDKVIVFDVGSANGCFVNDEQVKRRVLRDGDVVRFADRPYRFSA